MTETEILNLIEDGAELEIYPDYYGLFGCRASACRHTCCAGWEIDIDPESLARYEADGTPHICYDGDPHFELVADENLNPKTDRCAFLRPDNLCALIVERGEDYLCQICRDHPRYRNFWTGITETGLGISCEAAAELVLSRKEPMKLMVGGVMDGGFYHLTEELEAAIISRLPEDEQYLWELRRDLLAQASELEDSAEARLAEYFIYRQLPDALYDGLLDERIAFAGYSLEEVKKRAEQVRNVSGAGKSEAPDFEAYAEAARAYSEEFEYNPEKLKKLLESLSEE